MQEQEEQDNPLNVGIDVLPVITESMKTARELFDTIEKAIPTEKERILQKVLHQAEIEAKSKKNATKHDIDAYLKRIRAKKKALNIAIKMNKKLPADKQMPIDEITSDLLKLLQDIAD